MITIYTVSTTDEFKKNKKIKLLRLLKSLQMVQFPLNSIVTCPVVFTLAGISVNI